MAAISLPPALPVPSSPRLHRGRVLVVDDDVSMCDTVATALARRGFTVAQATSALEALRLIDLEDFDTIVTDVQMDGMDGLALCERVVARRPDVPVLVLTAFGTLQSATAALRLGAYDFLTKPFDVELLRVAVARAVQHRVLGEEVKRLRQTVGAARGFGIIVGASHGIRRVLSLVERVADTEASVLITGETGSGKELVAAALHRTSPRAAGPFVAVNCAALPDDLLESELFGHVKGAFTGASAPRVGLFLRAQGGTLFLDEIGEMSARMQSKLLRALQERTVRPVGSDREERFDARLLAATNLDLELAIEQRRFRQDLFYRINVVQVDVPPLRERGTDVLLLAQHFLAELAAQGGKAVAGFQPAVGEKLMQYSWPGNVRELRNCIERAVALARFDELVVDDLPEAVRAYRRSGAGVPGVGPLEILPMDEVERRYILRVLQQLGGSKTACAEAIGMDRRTLHRKLARYADPQRALGAGSPVDGSLDDGPDGDPLGGDPSN